MSTTPTARTRNAPGQGTIKPRKLANGKIVYDAWAQILDPVTRRSKKVSKRGHATRAEAQKWINKTVADAENGLTALTSRGLTVWSCWEGFKETTPLKESTVKEYERLFVALCSDMRDVPVTAVTQLQFDAMIARKRREGIPTTRLVHLISTWQHIYDYAIAAQTIRYNPAKMSPWKDRLFRDMRNEKQTRDLELEEEGYVEVISSEQYRMLLETEKREPLRNLWEFTGLTGMRRGEVLALEWGDVNLDEGTIWIRRGIADVGGELIHVPTPKGNRARRVYIDEVTVELLHRQRKLIEEYKARHGESWEDHDLVFPLMDARKSSKFPPGHWMPPSMLSMAYYRRAKALGFSSTKFHGLRFRWATVASMAGVPDRDIQEHMGHRNLDITRFTYIKSTDARKREAARKAGAALRGQTEINL